MGSTKIFVFRLKEILYTTFFIALGILLIILLINMFAGKKEKETTPSFGYTPGVYTASVLLDQQPIQVEVIVDKNHINSVKLVDLNEATQTLYPLLETAMSEIESQLVLQSSIGPVEVKTEYKYTSTLLLDAINDALSKAKSEVHN